MKRIYLIDCPGVVPPKEGDTPEDILLKGVVRVENVENPEQYVAALLRRCKKKHVLKTYDLTDFTNHIDFLEQLARKGGRLLRGGEADVDGVAKMVLNDFMRGKLPWFTPLNPVAAVSGADAPTDKAAVEAVVDAENRRKGVEGSRTGDVNRLNQQAMLHLKEERKRKRAAEDVDGEVQDEEEGSDAEAELLALNRAQANGDVEDEDDDEDDNDSFASFTDDSESEDGDAGVSLTVVEEDEEDE